MEVPRGTLVKYIGCVFDAQVKWGDHKDPHGLLDFNSIYTVERIEVHSWHAKVFLREFPGKSFNSVWFEEVLGGKGMKAQESLESITTHMFEADQPIDFIATRLARELDTRLAILEKQGREE